MSRRRIVELIALACGAVALLALALVRIMVVQHDDWLEHSYRNRWVFRDVPTRRGSLLDRAGRPIATDEPGFDLELRYRAFRRGHAVGLAVHGANLLLGALGLPERYRLDRPDALGEACRVVLESPVALLGDRAAEAARERGARRAPGEQEVRDLRFYAGSLLEALSGVDARHFYAALRIAAGDPHGATVLDVGRAVCAARPAHLRAAIDADAFAERVRELHAAAARLAGAGVDLFAVLEKRREAWRAWDAFGELPEAERETLREDAFWSYLATRGAAVDSWRGFASRSDTDREALVRAFEQLDDEARAALTEVEPPRLPWNEDVPYAIARRLPYGSSVWLTLLRDRHPGFLLRPAVRRVAGTLPGRGDLGSLAVLIGRVRGTWPIDLGEELDERAGALGTDSLEDFFASWPAELPGALDDALRRSADRTMYWHLLSRGRRGRDGVEAALDPVLAGDPGLLLVERDRRREQRLLSSLDVQPGRDVHLTVDLRLQELLEAVIETAECGREQAAALVDARTGDVLALASRPLVTPEGEPRSLSSALYPTTLPYVGSVIKPFVLLEHLTAQRAGLPCAAPEDFGECTGRLTPRLVCDHPHWADGRDPVRAVGRSCNVFFYHAIRGLGRDGLLRALARVGWADEPDAAAYFALVLGLPRGAGAAPKLNPGTFQLEQQAIGYGVEVNSVFVARAYGALATGYVTMPSIVKTAVERPRTPLGVAGDDLELVREGLRDCVDAGTARRIDFHGVRVWGKTGTAEIRGAGQNNAWFAGFLEPAAEASLAFAFVAYDVPAGRHGGDVAAPLAAELLRRVLEDAELAAAYLPGEPR